MKKIFTKIICGILSICVVLSMTACGSSEWKGTNMTDGGKLLNQSGFIAETDNYFYYLNGIATSTDDNSYGAPIKGTLCAADKKDLSKTEVVVPKLFAATNRGQGVFIYDGHVYYGTTNTEKNSDGDIANNELVFVKTSLDGKGTTEEFFKVKNLGVEYRFVEKEGVVYIVYYDADNTQLVSYNTTDKKETVIAKTDDKGDRSLDAYKFVEEKDAGKYAVVFTMKVYAEKYDEEKAGNQGYKRQEESYNEVYTYSAGDTKIENTEVVGKKVDILNGNNESELTNVVYALTLVKNGYVFFTETINGKTKNYALSFSDNLATKTEIVNSSYVADANIIVSLDEVYILDTSAGVVYKSTLTAKDNKIKEKVSISKNITKMLFLKGEELFFVNTDKYIAKLTLKTTEETRVSPSTIDSEWYAPQIKTVGEKEYIFYLDNSETGKGYIKAMDLSAEVVSEDKEDTEDKNVKKYLDEKAVKSMSVMTDEDKASVVSAEINKVESKLSGGVLKLTEKDGNLVSEDYDYAKKIYDEASDEVKELVSEDAKAKLDKYADVVKYSNLLVKLDGVQDYAVKEGENAKEKYKEMYDKYTTIKPEMDELFSREDSNSVLSLIEGNLKAHYTRATELFKDKK